MYTILYIIYRQYVISYNMLYTYYEYYKRKLNLEKKKINKNLTFSFCFLISKPLHLVDDWHRIKTQNAFYWTTRLFKTWTLIQGYLWYIFLILLLLSPICNIFTYKYNHDRKRGNMVPFAKKG